MVASLSVDLIAATVEVEQPLGGGLRTVGTGFLIADPGSDGRPRVVLVTADHVFERMKSDKATLGYRVQQPDGSWSFAPQKIAIRAGGKPLWRRHPTRDVAAIEITAPAAFAQAAIPLAWLGGQDALDQTRLSPGDEMMTLGFPQGLSANAAGFPILRAGRVASYPLGPSESVPTFLLDFRVFPGNSGGPVFLERPGSGQPGASERPLIAGLLTQQVVVGTENLGIGIVTQAEFIRETVALLDQPGPGPAAAPMPAAMPSQTASAVTRATAASERPTSALAMGNDPERVAVASAGGLTPRR